MGPEIGGAAAQGSGYALASAASVAMMLMVGFLVLARSPSSMVNRSFMGIVIACCLWMGGRAGTFGSLTVGEAGDWYTLSFVGLALLPSTIFLFATSATAETKQRLKSVIALLTISSALCLFSFVRPEAIRTIVSNPYTGWYPRFAIGGYLYIAFLIVVTAASGFIMLRSPIASSAIQRREKNRLRVILLALLAGYTALFDFLPAVGVMHPPIAHFSLLVGIVLCGYAVGRYHVVILTSSTTGDAIASTMQEALFFLDLEGRILFTNRALDSLLGYREGDLSGREASVIFAPDTPVDLDLGSRGRGLAGVRSAKLLTRTGGKVPATITVGPYFDEDGDTTGFVGLALEQAEKDRLDDRIRELEQEVHSIFNTSMFGVYVISDGLLEFVNEKAATMLGYDRDEVQGSELSRLIHPEDLALVSGRVAQREKGEDPENHYVLRALHKNGGIRKIEIFSMTIPRGEQFIILGFSLDVTESGKADQEILEAGRFTEWILKTLPAGTLLADRQGRIVFANAAAAELLGEESAQSMEGRHIRDAFAGDDPDVDAFLERCDDDDEETTEVPSLENHVLNMGEGPPLVLSMVAAPPAVGMEADYLLMINRTPPSATSPETVSCESGTQWIRLLLGSVSRDLEGLLGGILGYASLARALLPAEEKVSGYIDSITESAQKTLEITGRFGSLRRGLQDETDSLPVNEVVQTVVDGLRSRFGSTVEITLSLGDDVPAVSGSPGQLTEALLQLGINAVEAMPSGGTLGFTTGERHLDTGVNNHSDKVRDGRYACIEMVDSGSGIPEEIQEMIFDPFFTTKAEGDGTGIGLWFARSVVRNHGGSIFVESRPGEGATFRVCLPVSVEQWRIAGEETTEHEKSEGHVLIVDDEPSVREVGSELLEELGYEVYTAPDGAEAIELIEDHTPVDVMVLDMVMPRLNGEQTFNRLQEIDPSIKVVISSGYTEDEKVRGLLERGATAFVQKPYRARTLAKAVREAMEMRAT